MTSLTKLPATMAAPATPCRGGADTDAGAGGDAATPVADAAHDLAAALRRTLGSLSEPTARACTPERPAGCAVAAAAPWESPATPSPGAGAGGGGVGAAAPQLPFAPSCVRSGTAADQGRRPQMEDASVAVDSIPLAAAALFAGGGEGPAGRAPADGPPAAVEAALALDGGAAAPAPEGPGVRLDNAGGGGGGGGAAAGVGWEQAPTPAWLGSPGVPAAAGFYAVFDGHCGTSASHFAAARAFPRAASSRHFPSDAGAALTEAFLSIEADYAAAVRGGAAAAAGTTALAVVVWGGRVTVANAGDSRAVLSRRGKAIELSVDHKPAQPGERSRIERCGGYVCEDGLLCGELAVARAIGDHHLPDLKRAGSQPGSRSVGPLTAEPEVTEWALEGPGDEFILLACDGVWDVFSSQRAVEFARQRLRAHNCPQRCAEEVVAEAARMHSSDNLTSIVVCLGEDPPRPRVYSSSALSANASRRTSADGSRRDGSESAPPSAGPSPLPSPLMRALQQAPGAATAAADGGAAQVLARTPSPLRLGPSPFEQAEPASPGSAGAGQAAAAAAPAPAASAAGSAAVPVPVGTQRPPLWPRPPPAGGTPPRP